MRILFSILCLFICPTLPAQQTPQSERLEKRFAQIDTRARKLKWKNKDIILLSDSLTAPYKTELEKARAIFSWIATHIAYDCGAENRLLEEPEEVLHPHYYTQVQLQNILKTRRTRCDGFSFLFKLMCNLEGIYCSQLEGYARFNGEKVNPATVRPNHAWNAALLDGQWYEIDPTIGAGSCKGRRFIQEVNNNSFGMSADLLQKRYIRIDDHRQLHNQGSIPVRY